AESLLRIPDAPTQDALIAERILAGDWGHYRGQSEKLFVNAGVWGLMLTGRMLRAEEAAENDPGAWLGRLVARSGEGVIRAAVRQGMAIMGGQFVFGRSIREALDKRGGLPADQRCFSFDMLGEGARTASAASRYFELYAAAIESLGQAQAGEKTPLQARSSISIKLSALHPRYEWAQQGRVMKELLPRVRTLAEIACRHGLPLTIDAEEADRLDLSLDLLAGLARAPSLQGWDGLGLAVQAYQKRAPALLDWLAQLAAETGRCIPVRLVKGAYWDSEIKHAQLLALPDYPVYTRKDATDLAYLACAQRLFAAGERLYPQFATHNAHTIAAVHHLAEGRAYEYQRLHGMGELLYRAVRQALPQITAPLRVYAPVGAHQDLLPYLVRRLLENGANSSFVHRFLEDDLPVAEVVADPTLSIDQPASLRLPQPSRLYGTHRRNSRGLDLCDPERTGALEDSLRTLRRVEQDAACLIDGRPAGGSPTPVHAPGLPSHRVGQARLAGATEREAALRSALAAQAAWSARPVQQRAACLRRCADAMEAEAEAWLDLLSREAGRTLPDAIAEWREAIDFCRYYATEAEALFAVQTLAGPTGEANTLQMQGRGVFLCISPWNFPLAIFMGQVVAALVCGNAVLAKPADQTPLVAMRAVQALHAAGIPPEVLHLLLGSGAEVAEPLVANENIAGVTFTGSVATAKRIQRTLAAREGAIVPLIAETGGQNAMLVDSTALLEQACDDILDSAFGSAGQRCSALRVLLVQMVRLVRLVLLALLLRMVMLVL
ncbi:MAG: bifunctional proline dehydrogenase/L-glutamate gamma-semialdehyde dehydrogenase PutA, partial [Oceanococcaceae bacterium]